MGHKELEEIRAGRVDPEGESQVNTGRICGMIATILYGVILGGFCLCYGGMFCIGIMGAAADAR
jgi:hypothetical protein